MKARARELGLSDTKVAERAGLSQTRYATYTIDKFEPDLVTLTRICRVLQLTPNDLMGWVDEEKLAETKLIKEEITRKIADISPDLLQAIGKIIDALRGASAKANLN